MEDEQPFTHGFHEFYATPDLRRPREVHVTLIHGTFAKEAKWVGMDSPLARQLEYEAREEGVEVHIHTFRWSGGLSFRARKKDAIGLHDHLVNLINEHPNAAHCAVAHSHGGTILMQALGADVDLQAAMFRVLCISTPFLRLKSRSFDEEQMIEAGIRLGVFVALIVGALAVRAAPRLSRIFASQPLLATTGLLALLIGALGAASSLVSGVFERWKRYSERVFNVTDHPQLRRDQVLLMRTAADEAGFLLGLGATLAWAIERVGSSLAAIASLPFRLVVRRTSNPARFLVRATPVVLAASPVALFAILLPVPYGNVAGVVFLAALASIFVPGVLLLLSSFAQGLINVGFGREIALCAPFVAGTTETTPLGYWQVFQFPSLARLPLWKLQHSFIYESVSLRYMIARWLLFGEFSAKAAYRQGHLLPYQARP